MIITYIAVAVLCFVGSVRGSVVVSIEEVEDPCPEDSPCTLPTGDPTAVCVEGECGFYIRDRLATPRDNQCPYDNTHMLLAHPTDCHRYCRCDHSGTAICDMPCAPGTRFDGKLGVCVHDTGCSGVCASNPCVHGTCNPWSSAKTPWTCTCDDAASCFGWNCQFKDDRPCDDHVCCPPGERCLNRISQWWPLIPYTCVSDPCEPNPCLHGATCVAINDGLDYWCRGCPANCNRKNCECPPVGQCPADVCQGHDHANVPHPYDCYRYCACGLGGTVADMPCPAGLKFDGRKCQCNWPNQVDCYTGGLNELHDWIRDELNDKKK